MSQGSVAVAQGLPLASVSPPQKKQNVVGHKLATHPNRERGVDAHANFVARARVCSVCDARGAGGEAGRRERPRGARRFAGAVVDDLAGWARARVGALYLFFDVCTSGRVREYIRREPGR